MTDQDARDQAIGQCHCNISNDLTRICEIKLEKSMVAGGNQRSMIHDTVQNVDDMHRILKQVEAFVQKK